MIIQEHWMETSREKTFVCSAIQTHKLETNVHEQYLPNRDLHHSD